MGLDCSHDCWHGAYTAFNRWRMKIAELAGIPLPLMEGYYGHHRVRDSDVPELCRPFLPISWEVLQEDPIHILLDHSDCEGRITWSDCGRLADRLEEFVLGMPEEDDGGHIGNWRETTEQFIRGLRLAHSRQEDVEFH